MREGAACQAADSIPPSISDLLKSHTIKEKCRCCIYLFEMCRLVTGGEISRVGVIGCSSLCPHNMDMRHLLPLPPLISAGRRLVKGGELKEQTRRQAATHRLNLCHQSAPVSARESNQDEWGLSRPLEARLIGPNFISASNCSYRKINRASEHAAVRGGNTDAYK